MAYVREMCSAQASLGIRYFILTTSTLDGLFAYLQWTILLLSVYTGPTTLPTSQKKKPIPKNRDGANDCLLYE